MSASAAPALSVVLPADRPSTVATTLAALRGQSVADRLELVVVVPPGAAFEAAAAGAGFHSVRIVRCDGYDDGAWFARARAAGARQASAPIVAFGETHSFPQPAWAAALIAAHREPWAAVGAAIWNANPERIVSWANLLVDFAPWVERRERGEMDELPGHNTSYKRDTLLARGDRLEEALASETLLAAELRAEGRRLLFEPAAVTLHLNLGGPYWFVQRFDHDREWAVVRARHWSPARRALYVLAAPLIPWVRLSRIWPDLRRTGRAADLRLLATVFLGLVAGAAGEAAGYFARSLGGSARRLHEVEMHRDRFAARRAAAGHVA